MALAVPLNCPRRVVHCLIKYSGFWHPGVYMDPGVYSVVWDEVPGVYLSPGVYLGSVQNGTKRGSFPTLL